MKQALFISYLFISCTLTAQTQKSTILDTTDGPPDSRPGRCYTKVLNSDNTFTWESILCEWKKWESLSVLKDELEPSTTNYDEHYLNKRLRPILQRKLPLEIKSYYTSKASDATDECLALARAKEVGEYLIQEGLDRNQLKITIEPSKDLDTMWMQYRVINAIPKKWYLQ